MCVIDWLVCAIDCLTHAVDCLICANDSLICAVDCLICGTHPADREVEVDDVGHALDVEPARRHVRRHDHLHQYRDLRTTTRNVEWFQGGLVFKAHRLLYHSTLGSRVIKEKKKKYMGTSLVRKRPPPSDPRHVVLL